LPSLIACLDATLRHFGGVPTYALIDNPRTVSVDHVAGIPVRHPQIVETARHYGMTVHTCVRFDPESKGGSEATVKIAKADLVPTEANLLPDYASLADLETACDRFCATVNAMTIAHDIDLRRVVEDRLTGASPDLLRALLPMFVDALMGAEADVLCGADYCQRSGERVNTRNGYRHRDFDTRVGTLDVSIPKLQQGSYFPDWLLQRPKRAERALTSVVATCYLLGVSTRRMEKLVDMLGITSLSKSQVSVMVKKLDEQVDAFRNRPLDVGPYTFVAADALVLKVRENGRVVNVHTLVAVVLARSRSNSPAQTVTEPTEEVTRAFTA
jgi:hypothetical protein